MSYSPEVWIWDIVPVSPEVEYIHPDAVHLVSLIKMIIMYSKLALSDHEPEFEQGPSLRIYRCSKLDFLKRVVQST